MPRPGQGAFGACDDDELNFTFYGTPLDFDDSEYVSTSKRRKEIKQREETPKERFHGAFTGGFSAGYWNTVGSAEGFTPKEFVSSRDDRKGSKFQHCPEDYMDEEDLSEFGIAPKRVRVNDSFKPEERTFAGLRDVSSESSTITDTIKRLVVPTDETMGEKLLKTMRRNASQQSYINRMTNLSTHDDTDDFDDLSDYKLKTDLHGIGYEPLRGPSTSKTCTKALPLTAMLAGGKRLNISGEAFGYGHDSDDDEIYDTVEPDVYCIDDAANYDFKFGSSKHAKVRKNPTLLPVDTTDSIGQSKRRSKYDTPMIDGFVQALDGCLVNINELLKQKYNPPEVPAGWKPRPNVLFRVQATSVTSLPSISVHLEESSSFSRIGSKTKWKNFMEARDDSKFRPLMGELASKFVTSHVETAFDELKPGLSHVSDVKSLAITIDKKLNDAQQQSQQSIKEGKNESFSLSRQTLEWNPSRLLCKRFNVPVPRESSLPD